jgi:hypothetical protein
MVPGRVPQKTSAWCSLAGQKNLTLPNYDRSPPTTKRRALNKYIRTGMPRFAPLSIILYGTSPEKSGKYSGSYMLRSRLRRGKFGTFPGLNEAVVIPGNHVDILGVKEPNGKQSIFRIMW